MLLCDGSYLRPAGDGVVCGQVKGAGRRRREGVREGIRITDHGERGKGWNGAISGVKSFDALSELRHSRILVGVMMYCVDKGGIGKKMAYADAYAASIWDSVSREGITRRGEEEAYSCMISRKERMVIPLSALNPACSNASRTALRCNKGQEHNNVRPPPPPVRQPKGFSSTGRDAYEGRVILPPVHENCLRLDELALLIESIHHGQKDVHDEVEREHEIQGEEEGGDLCLVEGTHHDVGIVGCDTRAAVSTRRAHVQAHACHRAVARSGHEHHHTMSRLRNSG